MMQTYLCKIKGGRWIKVRAADRFEARRNVERRFGERVIRFKIDKSGGGS